MELALAELIEEIEEALRWVAIDPATVSNPGARGEDSPLAVLA